MHRREMHFSFGETDWRIVMRCKHFGALWIFTTVALYRELGPLLPPREAVLKMNLPEEEMMTETWNPL
jgi:hypothetical protein